MRKLIGSSALLLAPVIMICGISAQADEWDKKTVVTVDQSIEVPGAVLPAGTYVFKLVESPANRHVVQVFNQRENHIFVTVNAIPNYRLEPTGTTSLSFYEVPAGQPQPVRAWFYPGDNFGQEFIYKTDRNMNLASSTTTTATTPAPAPAPEPQQVAAALEPAPMPAPEPVVTPEPSPAPEPAQIASNEPAPAPAPEPVASAPVMPQTASNMPLFALLGILSIVSATVLSVFAKRMS